MAAQVMSGTESEHCATKPQIRPYFVWGLYAACGNDNTAYVVGPENSYAVAYLGDSDHSYVVDPFGTTTTFADTGYGFNSDLAAVLFTDGGTASVSANGLYDVLLALGSHIGTF